MGFMNELSSIDRSANLLKDPAAFYAELHALLELRQHTGLGVSVPKVDARIKKMMKQAGLAV